jgi:hypothetical protein
MKTTLKIAASLIAGYIVDISAFGTTKSSATLEWQDGQDFAGIDALQNRV